MFIMRKQRLRSGAEQTVFIGTRSETRSDYIFASHSTKYFDPPLGSPPFVKETNKASTTLEFYQILFLCYMINTTSSLLCTFLERAFVWMICQSIYSLRRQIQALVRYLLLCWRILCVYILSQVFFRLGAGAER